MADITDNEDIARMTNEELRARLEREGQDSRGAKTVLVARLEVVLAFQKNGTKRRREEE
eukprot:CAMPEP_0118946668 /NCGR_PEP_ID=MMETSP1169-20130426/44617_1 /TAXON_ID=36882 /ORGANISM="Pyramimonas obovata, Strain CCMP722" /LENGTH=58 /DNA_ID=CAMNT_0006892697 /DNA_START=119 /DNA_END=292 /DNA_ORIENTATION=+